MDFIYEIVFTYEIEVANGAACACLFIFSEG